MLRHMNATDYLHNTHWNLIWSICNVCWLDTEAACQNKRYAPDEPKKLSISIRYQVSTHTRNIKTKCSTLKFRLLSQNNDNRKLYRIICKYWSACKTAHQDERQSIAITPLLYCIQVASISIACFASRFIIRFKVIFWYLIR